jgi:hypothetical protein
MQAATMSFNQVDWLADTGGYTMQYSDWGVASLQLDSEDAGLFSVSGSGLVGYLNLVTTVPQGNNQVWSIQNMGLYFDNATQLHGRLPESISFDLGITPGSARVTGLDYHWTINPVPLSTMPGGTMEASAVSSTEWLFGGESGTVGGVSFSGGTGQAAPPKASSYVGVPAGGSIASSGSIKIAENQIYRVDEDGAGCAPGAAARSLNYLSRTDSRIALPGITIQDIYGELVDDMGTDISWSFWPFSHSGTGTSEEGFLSGKDAFAARHNLPLETEPTTDWQNVIDSLNSGADVEIGVSWGKNGDGKSLGGHCAFVSQVQKILDRDGNVTGYSVKIMDDPKQGDGNPANASHWLDFDKDGNLLQAGTGAKLNSFRVETVIPEPSTLSLLVLGALTLIRCRRRSG